MKKSLLFFIIPFAFATAAMAQTSGGPDIYGYTWKNNAAVGGPTFSWIDIIPFPETTVINGLTDDNIVGPFNIGFPFRYYWYDVTKFWVGSNGYIAFNGAAQLAHSFPTIPTSGGLNDFIAPFASDLNFDGVGNPGKCYYWKNNANDTLIVSWVDVPFWQQAAPTYIGSNSFQLILSMVDTSITYQYLTQTGTTTNAPNFVSTGLENNSGSIGLQVLLNAYPTAASAVKFYYPQNSPFQVNDASTEWNDNVSTGGRFISRNGAQYEMKTEVKNSGNQALAPFNVWMRVVNANNFIQVQQTIPSNALTPNQTQAINATNMFNPTTAGTFRFITTTQLAGDATPSNNTRTLELSVIDSTLSLIRLSYDDGIPDGAGLSWSGGGGGLGMEFVPPFYPMVLKGADFFVTANPNTVGFSMQVFDNSGPGGTPGVRLDSVFVAPGSIILNAWTNATLPTPITVNSGSVFISWMMAGDGIALGNDDTQPISNRSYEILGSSWASYRSRDTRDPMINALVSTPPGTGIAGSAAVNQFSDIYPNPANERAYIDINLAASTSNLSVKVYGIDGKLLFANNRSNVSSGSHRLNFEVSNLSSGIYMTEITTDAGSVTKKMVINGR